MQLSAAAQAVPRLRGAAGAGSRLRTCARLPALGLQRSSAGDSAPPTAAWPVPAPQPPADPAPSIRSLALWVGGRDAHIHVPFAALGACMAGLAAVAAAPEWHVDLAAFATGWAALWAACCRLRPSPRTVALLCLLPCAHLAGATGAYRWELGNLSYDIIVHTSNGFIGTLMFEAILHDTAAGRAAAAPGGDAAPAPGSAHGWPARAWGALQLSALLIVGTSLIEVLEAAGGQLGGTGEGIFLRGPGDFCTSALPCSEEVDTAKDMVDNVVGMTLALLALATRGGGSSAGGAGGVCCEDEQRGA